MPELGYVGEEDAFLGVRSYPEAKTFPGALIVHFDAPLSYANVPVLEEWLISMAVDRPSLKYVVIDCRGVNTTDATAVGELEDLVSGHRDRGTEILFVHAKLPVHEWLKKAGWKEEFGDIFYPPTRDALWLSAC